MIHPTHLCLWHENDARAAADFYCSLFPNSRINADNGMVVIFELDGHRFMGLNGRKQIPVTPAISVFVWCDTEAELQKLYDNFLDGGAAMMELGEYPWAEKYAWVKDRYGLTWQLMLRTPGEDEPRIAPCLLFVGDRMGQAGKAAAKYTQTIPQSAIERMELYGPGSPAPEGTVMFSIVKLGDTPLVLMDGAGPHAFSFTDAVSLVAACDTQDEIDQLWESLTRGGEEGRCGWLKDSFGVSWQVVPARLSQMVSDPERAPRVMQAFLQMKKFDIAALENA